MTQNARLGLIRYAAAISGHLEVDELLRKHGLSNPSYSLKGQNDDNVEYKTK